MSSNNQGFPQIGLPFVASDGHITQTWLQLLISLWQRTGGGQGGGFAPPGASYLVEAVDPNLPNAVVVEDSPTVNFDFSAPGEAKANVVQSALQIEEGQVTNLIADLAGKASVTVSVLPGEGLSGGGPLSSSVMLAVAPAGITNDLLAQMPADTIKGNNTAGTAAPLDLTATQVTALLNPFTSLLKGLVPVSGGGTTNFLRADVTFANPLSGGVSGTVSLAKLTGGGTNGSLTVANGLITNITNPT